MSALFLRTGRLLISNNNARIQAVAARSMANSSTRGIPTTITNRVSVVGSRLSSTSSSSNVVVSETRASDTKDKQSAASEGGGGDDEKVLVESCGDVDSDDDDDMEQEEMFVAAHDTFEHGGKEWGGPRRGGRLLEPTRFGDWERKGRCTDF